MKKSSAALTLVTSIGVLGTGWAIGTAPATTTPTTTGKSSSTGTTSGTRSGTTGGTTSGTTSSGTTGTYTGATASHRYGSVTVTVTLANGTITDVQASYSADGRSQRYNERALPILRAEVLAANSTSVQTVSGATYTSDAYLTSLQSALDQAK